MKIVMIIAILKVCFPFVYLAKDTNTVRYQNTGQGLPEG